MLNVHGWVWAGRILRMLLAMQPGWSHSLPGRVQRPAPTLARCADGSVAVSGRMQCASTEEGGYGTALIPLLQRTQERGYSSFLPPLAEGGMPTGYWEDFLVAVSRVSAFITGAGTAPRPYVGSSCIKAGCSKRAHTMRPYRGGCRVSAPFIQPSKD
jgi:hypothetical protein